MGCATDREQAPDSSGDRDETHFMRRGRFIRTSLILGSLCVSAWQAPNLLERLDGVLPRAGSGAPDIGALLGPTHAAGGAPKQPTVVVYGAGGKPLTDAERAALLEEARRNAPIPLDGEAPNDNPQSIEQLLEQARKAQEAARPR